jgi:SRSO17 transposase
MNEGKMLVAGPLSLFCARLSCACGFSSRDKEAVAAGLTGIFLILLQAKNQPDLSAPRASLEVSLQCFIPLPSLIFTLHSATVLSELTIFAEILWCGVMIPDESSPITREHHFDQFLAKLGAAVDHPSLAKALRDYCAGLLLLLKRKSIEPIAAQVAPGKARNKHQSVRQFIADPPWCDAAVMRVIRNYVSPAFERYGGVTASVVDDTSLPKNGSHSGDAARQYCDQLGKVANCQVAVSLSWSNHWMSLPIAHDLYLTEEWANDLERRKRADVPEQVELRNKIQIALGQIDQAVNAGVELGVISTDAAYSNNTDFRDELTTLGLRYCVAVRGTTTVWEPGKGPLPPKKRGRRGRTVALRENAKGELSSCFAAVRVRPAHRDHLRREPRPEEWLLVEWPLGESAPTNYWLSTLPRRSSRKRLVYFAKIRWRIERDYEELKQETGLGHYEGCKWRGFHHHATMCIAVYGFLVSERGLFSPRSVGCQPRFKKSTIPGSQRPDLPAITAGMSQSEFT